jgi:hypothetical protein
LAIRAARLDLPSWPIPCNSTTAPAVLALIHNAFCSSRWLPTNISCAATGTFCGALRTYGLLVGAVSHGQYEARVRELIERTDIVFSTMIETA